MKGDKRDYKKENKELKKEIGNLQIRVRDAGFPVLILFDGWESSGKGFMVNELITEMDPRSFKIKVYEEATEDEKRKPFLWRFWQGIPPKGSIHIYIHSYYKNIMSGNRLGKPIAYDDVKDIELFEKQLTNDGTLIIKFFLEVSKKDQEDRVKNLASSKYTDFRVSDSDWDQIKRRKEYKAMFREVLSITDYEQSHWNIISTDKKQKAVNEMLTTVKNMIERRLENGIGEKEVTPEIHTEYIPRESNVLGSVDLTKKLEVEEYQDRLDKLQLEAKEVAYALYTKRIPSIIIFEGWDAAGKGGAIKRLTQEMDPRGYEVIPISAPDSTEKQYNYMWRFYKHMPKSGHMTIFDRSWYGRVMVERVENLVSANDYMKAFDEINSNEKHIANFDTLIIKFFVHIDKEEQLRRFNDREEDPDKNYKLTDEDWRNRDKWNIYEEAIEEMLARTNTPYAPWVIVGGNDKYYARIKVLETFLKMAREKLKKA